jgi:hypothetical protein
LANTQRIRTGLEATATQFSAELDRRPAAPSDPSPNGKRARVRPALYVAILVATILGATGYKLRHSGLFACEASGYSPDHYLAYCQATSYGDYDYGAFWYGLEPAGTAAAANADVLLLGDSRLEFGLSTDATRRWFSSHSLRYYLLGFAYNGNMAFARPLLARLQPKARLYVINVDRFFRDQPTPPAQAVMRDSSARARYDEKRLWQAPHRSLCKRLGSLCGDGAAFFRARSTGAWVRDGGEWSAAPVAYSDSVDRAQLDSEVVAGRRFLSALPVTQDCIVLTMIPKSGTALGNAEGTARAIAASLGLPLVAPRLDSLSTFDGSHLDGASAERWSAAFFDAAAPLLQKCLSTPRA